MRVTEINRALPSGYSARFAAAADAAMDDAIEILLHGVKTRWALQIGAGYVCINEYGFENGELAWMDQRGTYKAMGAAVKQLVALLQQESKGR